jgi:cysteine desulfurase / selenocysteine lyase
MKTTKQIRKDFPIFTQTINGKCLSYLDNASTTQKPEVVIDAISNYYQTNNSNTHRSVHELASRATIQYEHARSVVAKFINAKTEEIIFTSGTTDSLNKLALSLRSLINEGDEIILTEMEHHSNLIPWQQIAKEKNTTIKWIPINGDFRLDLTVLPKLITKKTKIISLTHISNVLGTINPVKEIISKVKELNPNIITVIDAAQSVPHMVVDVTDLNCDFLAFSGHKALGPMGVGVLYGKLELLKKINPSYFGGGMVLELTKENSAWNDLPYKFEAGTPNVAGAVGLATALNYLNEITKGNVEKQMRDLTDYGLKKLQKISNLTLLGPKNSKLRAPIFSFTIKGMHPHDVSEILNNEGIAVRGGHHCAKVLFNQIGVPSASRASFYIYNSVSEVDNLVEAIKKAKKIFQVE